MWLRNYELGEERSCLLTDQHTSRGWEASHILVIALDRQGLENLVMRTVGFCALVRDGATSDPDSKTNNLHPSGLAERDSSRGVEEPTITVSDPGPVPEEPSFPEMFPETFLVGGVPPYE